jgi:hypothetical protein
MAFRAELRHRWRSWLAIAILISVVGGLVVAAVAAGRRTEAAFPQFVAAHGFDADVYATQPVAKVAELPGVTSATELVSPDTGQRRRATAPTRSTRRTSASSSRRRRVDHLSSSSRAACPTRRPPTRCWHRSLFNRTTACAWGA